MIQASEIQWDIQQENKRKEKWKSYLSLIWKQ